MKKSIIFIFMLAISFGTMAQNNNLVLRKVYNFRNSKGFLELYEGAGQNGKQGLYNNTTDRWEIYPNYYFDNGFYVNANNFGYGVARGEGSNSYCVFDTYGNLVIPYSRYTWISSNVLPGFFLIASNNTGKWGVIDVKGRIYIPFKYDSIFLYDNMFKRGYSKVLVPAFRSGKWGFVDLAGREVTKFIYNSFAFGNNDWYYAKLDYNGCWFYVDDKFDVLKIEKKNDSYSSNSSYNNRNTARSNSDGSLIKAVAIGAFVGLAAVFVDAIFSGSSSSSSSSYSSSSSSSYSSSSSHSTSICSYCTGRGMMNCVWCEGSGIIKGGWFEEDQTCFSCKGRGQVWCWHCSGRGSR